MPIDMVRRQNRVHLPDTVSVYNSNGFKDHGHGGQEPAGGMAMAAKDHGHGRQHPAAGMASMAAAEAPRWRAPDKEHPTVITLPWFKSWLKQFDTDHDGRISRKELREAIRRRGASFAGLRAMFAVRRADHNHNGFVDDSEIESLIQFAEKELGFRITMDAPPAGDLSAGGRVMSSPAAAPPLYRPTTTYMAY